MKPTDLIAVATGTATAALPGDSLEQVLTAAAAAIAVYLVKAFLDWLKEKLK